MLIEEKRGVDESYSSAVTTSDMRVEAEVRGDADTIIAAGCAPNRLGSTLLRLRTEWDAVEKPRRVSADAITRIAGSLTFAQASAAGRVLKIELSSVKVARVPVLVAQAQADDWFKQEVLRIMSGLKSLAFVRDQLCFYMADQGIKGAKREALEMIGWWLQQLCQECNGTKFQVVVGTSRHSGKTCPECHGTGLAVCPNGQNGRKVANWLDDCILAARHQIGRRLRNSMNRD